MSRFKTLPEAIGMIEGYGKSPTNRPTRLNNPGDINMAEWLKAPPYYAVMETVQPGVIARFAKFPTVQQGYQALSALLLGPAYRHLTIAQAINRYAPPVENDTTGYVKFVCAQCGCQPTDIVQDVMTRSQA